MCFTLFKSKRLLQPRPPGALQMSEDPKHVGLRSRMNPGTLVQYTIDRRSTQPGGGDNVIDTYGAPNIHRIFVLTLSDRIYISKVIM
jgi:hypothetical protein